MASASARTAAVDVATGEHDDDGPAAAIHPAGEQRRQRDCPAGLDDELQFVEGVGDGGERLAIADRQRPLVLAARFSANPIDPGAAASKASQIDPAARRFATIRPSSSERR